MREPNISHVIENAYTLSRVEENLKEINKLLITLIEAKAEYKIEIKHISASTEQILSELKHIDNRLTKIESSLLVKNEKTFDWKSKFIEIFKDYWQFMAILLSIISFILSYFFGFNIKVD